DLRLQLSASEGELDPRRAGLDATLWFAEPPWPADMRVFELATERIGPVLSPHHPRCAEWQGAPPAALLGEPLLHPASRTPAWAEWHGAPPAAMPGVPLRHPASRPQAWPCWARQHNLVPARLRLGQSFEHLYFLLEAALAGLWVAIAPQQLVADDLTTGRL